MTGADYRQSRIVWHMSDSPTVLVKAKLQRRRMLAGLSQPELAAKAGYDPSYISLLERGGRKGTGQTVRRLAEALGCKIEDLVTGEHGEDDDEDRIPAAA